MSGIAVAASHPLPAAPCLLSPYWIPLGHALPLFCIIVACKEREASAERWHRWGSSSAEQRAMVALPELPAGPLGLAIKVSAALLGIVWWTSGPGADEARYDAAAQ